MKIQKVKSVKISYETFKISIEKYLASRWNMHVFFRDKVDIQFMSAMGEGSISQDVLDALYERYMRSSLKDIYNIIDDIILSFYCELFESYKPPKYVS